MIRTIIVDDELLARKNILSSLSKYPDFEVIEECRNGKDALKTILSMEPDLVFLDIQMPEMDGLEVVRNIGVEKMPFVIFVTAYDKYAINAFDAHALDYLLKPFTKERFHEAIEIFLKTFPEENSQAQKISQIIQDLQDKKTHVNRIAIQTISRIYFLHVDEIDWIESAGNYVDIHAGNETHLLRETMKNMESKLDPEKFIRAHRSYIVNVERIMEIQPDGNDFLVLLSNGKTLGMSRHYKSKLDDVIEKYF